MTPRKIKALRLEMKMTQTQFAEFLGVTFVTVNRWENGKAKPSPLAARAIEQTYTQFHGTV